MNMSVLMSVSMFCQYQCLCGWGVFFYERVGIDVCVNVLSISVPVCLCGWCVFFMNVSVSMSVSMFCQYQCRCVCVVGGLMSVLMHGWDLSGYSLILGFR